MERMTMRTAGQVAAAAAARLRAVAVSLATGPAMALPGAYVPATGSRPGANCPSTQGWIVVDGKPGTTGGFRLTGHTTRRHPERSP